MNKESKTKILLHACCAICSSHPIELLQNLGYEVVVYFYNPNIYPHEEYENRLNAQKELCNHFNCQLVVGEYDESVYLDYVKGFENEPEKGKRCDKCFELRLLSAAKMASKLGIKNFTTSIVISPHKNYQKITEIGKNIASKYDLEYVSIDFKKKDGFLKSNKISKQLGLYRQNYCGCRFSIR